MSRLKGGAFKGGKSLAGFTDEYVYDVVINNELKFDGDYDGQQFKIYENPNAVPETLNFDYDNETLIELNENFFKLNVGLVYGSEVSTEGFIDGITLTQINTYAISVDETDFALLEDGETDDAVNLNSLINNSNGELTAMGYNIGDVITYRVESSSGFIFMNSKVSVPSGASLHFITPIVIGRDFTIELTGNFRYETTLNGDGDLGSGLLDGSYAEGVSTIGLTDPNFGVAPTIEVSSWAVNDLVSIRDESEDTRQDVVITAIVDNGGGAYDISFTPTLNFDAVVNDTIRKFQQQRLAVAGERGDTILECAGDSDDNPTRAEDMIMIKDFRKLGAVTGYHLDVNNSDISPTDITRAWYSNNDWKLELTQILRRITGGAVNSLVLTNPLSNDFDINNTYVIRMNPKTNQFIKGLVAYQLEEPILRSNNHLIHVQRCMGCKIIDTTFSDDTSLINMVTYPTSENLVRVRESFKTDNINPTYLRSTRNHAGSGASYGCTIYYSSNCSIINPKLSTLRHNILFQGCTRCKVEGGMLLNPMISALDTHGLNERDNIFNNIYIDIAGNGALDDDGVESQNSTIAGIRVGNSFHPQGSHYNEFNNIVVNLGQIADETNITTLQGIEIVPQSTYNTFNNCKVKSQARQTGARRSVGLWIQDHRRYSEELFTQNNKLINCMFEGLEEGVVIDGGAEFGGDYNFESGTFSINGNSTTSIFLDNADSSVTEFTNEFEFYYGGSTKTINGTTSNLNRTLTILTGANAGAYEITNSIYGGLGLHNLTITPAMTNTTLIGETYEIRQRDSAGVIFNDDPTDFGTRLLRCSFSECDVFITTNNTSGLIIDNCYFDKQQTTNQRQVIELQNATSPLISNNTLFDCYRIVNLNETTDATITFNKKIIQDTATYTNPELLTTTGTTTNSNIVFTGNYAVGSNYTNTFTNLGGTDTFRVQREFYGINEGTGAPILTLNQDNGRVGIGSTQPDQELDLVGDMLATGRAGFNGLTNFTQDINIFGQTANMSLMCNGNLYVDGQVYSTGTFHGEVDESVDPDLPF